MQQIAKGLKKGKNKVIDVKKDDWIDENSIGHDPLMYIEGSGLIPIGNPSKPYFLSFPGVWNNPNRNLKVRSKTSPSVVLVWVGSTDVQVFTNCR